MLNSEVVYINVGIMDDEPKARQRAVRIIENWSLDLQNPELQKSQATPLLWKWLRLKSLNERKISDKNAKPTNPDVINIKARILLTAQTPSEFESKIDERTKFRDFDVIISDIMIPDEEYDGLEFAKRWNNQQDAPVFVMVSAHDLAIKAFNVDVADYILKPLKTNTLSLGLCKAITKKASKDSMNKDFREDLKKVNEKSEDLMITASSPGGKYHSLFLEDILMFKADSKCTIVSTNTKDYFYEHSLKKIAQIYKNDFIRIRRNFLVSIDHIIGFTNTAKREDKNKDVKGRQWFVRINTKNGIEDIEISRRCWSEIYRICEINPNIDCKKDIIEITPERAQKIKFNIKNNPDLYSEDEEEYED